jgi:alkanesulfonate monooxygenase SsuD/methylene tetrahydromethanopterin reductase-like flavin-dependent oxidoreductase (luciferase family)
MKFGLFYLFSDLGNIPQDQLFREILEEIEYGEELGYDSVWLPEHHFAVYGMLGNPMTLAAAISQRTKKMKIGTAIMVLPFQHPLRLAEDAALVDCLSEGRLLWGLGRGYQPPEFHGFGVPQHASRGMFMESFEILRRALSGEKFTYDGHFWKIEEPTEIFPKPIQKPYPPMYLAAVSPPSYEIAARLNISLLRSPQFSNLDSVAEAYDG